MTATVPNPFLRFLRSAPTRTTHSTASTAVAPESRPAPGKLPISADNVPDSAATVAQLLWQVRPFFRIDDNERVAVQNRVEALPLDAKNHAVAGLEFALARAKLLSSPSILIDTIVSANESLHRFFEQHVSSLSESDEP